MNSLVNYKLIIIKLLFLCNLVLTDDTKNVGATFFYKNYSNRVNCYRYLGSDILIIDMYSN